MDFYFFHLMPWPYLPDDYEQTYDSAWVTLPNKLYDPVRGHELYSRYLDELELADAMGFDGICVNEHHQSAWGTMPSPNVMAGALARRTKRAKICILGNAIPLREHPLRVAEEVAMIDVMSGGRVVSGFVRGIGAEYHTFGMDPSESRERFIEAHDLIVRAWSEPGPFSFEGTYYRQRHVNIWPRPIQRPHPPIWIPSQGSGETIAWAAERRYTYMQNSTPAARIKAFYEEYRQRARQAGYESTPQQLGWAVPVYVSDTDARAREEAWPHLDYYFNKLLRMPQQLWFPPGYLTDESERRVLAAKRGYTAGPRTLEDVEREALVIMGSPASVCEQLEHWYKELGYGVLIAFLQFGTLPSELTRRNVDLFVREVMPRVRPLGAPQVAA